MTLPETEYEDEQFRPLGLGPEHAAGVALEALREPARSGGCGST